jgi:arylsulfatase A-like enzyme
MIFSMRPVSVFVVFTAVSLLNLTTVSAAPNIVVLISDDMGWGDVGFNGSEIKTPEIDRLAAEGIRLNRYYVQSVCSPTRATLMTGRSPLSTGMLSPLNPWYAEGLATDEKLLPEYLREGGYQTHAVGKWHLGPNESKYHPLNRGFDTYYGSLHGYLNHENHTVFGRIDWQRDGNTVEEEGHITHLLADEAVRIIENHEEEQPFFLYVSFTAPHSPLQAPEAAIAAYADIEDENRRTYAAMVSELDRAIARISNALDEAQIADETLLMFFTDNGGVPRLGARNEPLRGGKNSPWEGGIRVPALIHGLSELEGGTVFDQRMTVMDLLPTFLDAADIPLQAPKPIAGQNMWPALSEGVPTVSQNVVLSSYQASTDNLLHAYFSDKWKLVQATNEANEIQRYLFDIKNDPYEENDLAAEYPVVLNRLVAELEAIPKVPSVTKGQPGPDQSEPGAPSSVMPDNRPPVATPYAESGPIPYPLKNYPE